MPPGPGMFSIITCWPNLSVSLAAMMREVTSATPPAPNGRMSLIGFSGHFACAWPSGASATIKAAGSASSANNAFLIAILPEISAFLLG